MSLAVVFAACLTVDVPFVGVAEAVENAGPEGRPKVVPTLVMVRSFAAVGADAEPVAEGQGFVVEANGVVLTSYEVLVDPSTQTLHPRVEAEVVGDASGRRYIAAIVSVEPTLNFAILKIDPEGPLVASKICERENIVPGQHVHALAGIKAGVPVFNSGEITDLNSMECYQESMTATMLRARIEIPQSSIGAPVFDDAGEVVGMFTGHVARAGEEYDEDEVDDGKLHILPIFLVFNIYESLKLTGSLKSPWTGFSVRPASESERAIFPFKRYLGGIGIDHVWKGGPAEKLGIREDDLLVGFSYYPVHSVADFQKWLYRHGVGLEVKLHFVRDRKHYYVVDYKIEERPKWAVPR